MKTLKDLNGVKELTKNQQRSIKGGVMACDTWGDNCLANQHCQYCQDCCDYRGCWGICLPGNP